MLKLESFKDVVDQAFIAERDNEGHKFKDQRNKKPRKDWSPEDEVGNENRNKKVRLVSLSTKSTTPKTDTVCQNCGKNHGTRSCYKDTGGCYRCGKIDHKVRECLEPRDFKPNEHNSDEKRKKV